MILLLWVVVASRQSDLAAQLELMKGIVKDPSGQVHFSDLKKPSQVSQNPSYNNIYQLKCYVQKEKKIMETLKTH